MAVSLDTLLRESALTYGHIQLFRNKDGWQASVCHYGTPPAEPAQQTDSKVFDDPVEALSKCLGEDARKTADLRRRYANAPKHRDVAKPAAVAEDFMGMIG